MPKVEERMLEDIVQKQDLKVIWVQKRNATKCFWDSAKMSLLSKHYLSWTLFLPSAQSA